MPAFTVLRIAKLKTWGAIAGTDLHNSRQRETPNADPERTPNNRLLLGRPDVTAHDAIKEELATQRIRKNAVLGVEILISVSPEYFRPANPSRAGTYDPERLKDWTRATTNWLQFRYGRLIKRASLHLDEATPHMHVVMVPLDERGKLNCRSFFGGSRHTLSNLQTDYAKAVSHLGIERGITNSRAKHQKVSQYYTLTQVGASQELPAPRERDPPEMPNRLMRLSDAQLMQYAQEASAIGAKAQREAIEPIVSATRNEAALLRRENLNLKRINSHLTKEKTIMQKQLDQVRGLDLGKVLTELFHAKGPYVPDPRQAHRYELPDRRKVFVKDNAWEIPPTMKGKGAIDLIMALRGNGQPELQRIIGELAHTFGVEKVTAECVANTIDLAAETVQEAMKEFTPEKKLSRGLSLGL